jgi:hypothetical protein
LTGRLILPNTGKRCPAVTPLRPINKPDFEALHMSKVKPEIANPFIPSRDPVCHTADLFLVLSVLVAGVAAALIALARALA